MTGYESVADVIACGSAVQAVACGDRVVAFYGHRTAAIVPEARVVPIPSDIPDSEALLLILACDAAKGVSKAPLHPHTRIAITGCGTMGLLTLFNLHARGLRQCVVIDPHAQRRQLALAFGAHAAYDPSDPQLANHRCQAGFECSSRDAAFQLLQELLLPDGHLCVLADGNLEPFTLTPAFHSKELSVVGSSDGLEYTSYAPWFWERVRTNVYPLQRLFERRIDSVQLPEVFEQLATSDERPIKVFVSYPHEEMPSL